MRALPPVGARVRLVHDVDRYPHFVAPAGALGTVADTGDPNLYGVRLDVRLAGAETWDNEVLWSLDAGDDPSRSLELVADFVNRDALRAATTDELRGIIAAGGPDELMVAAGVELNSRPANPLERSSATSYERASADVVVALTFADAHVIADGLELLADLDEGEHVDDEALRRVAALVRSYLADPVDVVAAALPAAGASPLEYVEAADRALSTLPGYIGSVPEGRQFVADLLVEDGPGSDDPRAIAAWLVERVTAE